MEIESPLQAKFLWKSLLIVNTLNEKCKRGCACESKENNHPRDFLI